MPVDFIEFDIIDEDNDRENQQCLTYFVNEFNFVM